VKQRSSAAAGLQSEIRAAVADQGEFNVTSLAAEKSHALRSLKNKPPLNHRAVAMPCLIVIRKRTLACEVGTCELRGSTMRAMLFASNLAPCNSGRCAVSEAGEKILNYHPMSRGRPVFCPAGRIVPPVPG
jgi:hypothetical protein